MESGWHGLDLALWNYRIGEVLGRSRQGAGGPAYFGVMGWALYSQSLFWHSQK
jgi:hypothetical protein